MNVPVTILLPTDPAEIAWAALRQPVLSDADTRAACKSVLTHCRDARRDTARDILCLIDGKAAT